MQMALEPHRGTSFLEAMRERERRTEVLHVLLAAQDNAQVRKHVAVCSAGGKATHPGCVVK